MKCDSCKKEKKRGSTYNFAYGKRIEYGTPEYERLMHGIYSYEAAMGASAYKIAGYESAWICRQCTLTDIFAPFLIGVVFVLIAGGLFYLMIIGEPVFKVLLFFLSLIGFVIGINGFRDSINQARVSGENRAIAASEVDLRREGYDCFFNHVELAKKRYIG